MKTMYMITGTRKEGDRVRLYLKLAEIVKKELDPTSIMTNISRYVEDMKLDALRSNQPESVTVPINEWNERKWNIDDTVFIEVIADE